MIDRIVNMVIRQLVRKAVNGGVRTAMNAGRAAMQKRGAARAAAPTTEIDQDASITQRRRLHPDERSGDNVLYPTDEYTDGMQPRR